MSDAAPEGQPRVLEDVPGAEHGGMPRWVKVFLGVVLVLVALLVIGKVTGIGGEHGPGRHGGGSDAPASESEDGGHRSPIDHGP
jgi:hypothetical protein